MAAFPAEAGIAPGFEAIDDILADALASDVLADLCERASKGEGAFLRQLEVLSLRMGQQGAEAYLKRCAAFPTAFERLELEDLGRFLRQQADLPEGDAATILGGQLAAIDTALFERLIEANIAWGSGKKAVAIVENLRAFAAATPAERAVMLPGLSDNLLKKANKRPSKDICAPAAKQLAAEPDYAELVACFADWYLPLVNLPARLDYLDDLEAALAAGRSFVAAYGAAKRARGYADFSDLIAWTLRLLAQPGIGDWIRYKLDARVDHILVDEAQDTNADQWQIIRSMADEYFSGNAETEDRFRTLFMVGDFKQAIYGFQGAQPRQFVAARNRFRELAEAARHQEPMARAFADLTVARSFRSAPAVLDLVDRTIEIVGYEAMGLDRPPVRHEPRSLEDWGRVDLWPAFALDEEEVADEEGEEDWLDVRDRQFATRLADKVAAMIARDGVDPGDILILLRRRSELASLLVARLFAAGVPVAGVDRLFLSRPLAVQDLLAAVRFATQPLDDLSLACLLVGPLFGWSQEELQGLAIDRGGASLWTQLRAADSDKARAATAALADMLRMADYVPPSIFLETILSGPLQGRRKLMGRLGEDARDPIEELLNNAIAYERAETVSLDGFLHRIESEETEVKREADGKGHRVRVMTVHGAKGLEAPVVILADATWDPEAGGGQGSVVLGLGTIGDLPVPRPRKDERGAPFDTALDALEEREREEHWRLLYVALTRAARHLVVAGTLPRPRGANGVARVAQTSWHAQVRSAMETMDCAPLELDWAGEGLRYETGTRKPRAGSSNRTAVPDEGHPEWLHAAAPAEARPPRPLRPSALPNEEDLVYPPPSPSQRGAMERGILIHALLERLPAVDPGARAAAADHWLRHARGIEEPARRRDLVTAALGVIDDSAFAFLFAPGSLAEAPLTATLDDGNVVAGIVDRLLVEDDRVAFVDYKTGANVPASVEEIPPPYVAQVEAYTAALAQIFPERRIEGYLLYTAGPTLFPMG